MPLHDSLQGHDVQRLGIRVFGRCLSFCNLHFGRWRFGWFLFDGLSLLFLHRLLILFHFIFVSHDKDSLLSLETRKNELDRREHDPKHGSLSVRCPTLYADFDASSALATAATHGHRTN